MPHRRHQLGKRRTALAGAALFCITRGAAYLPQVRAQPVQEPLIAAAAGREWLLAIYASLWLVVGFYCLASIPRARLLWPMNLTAGMSVAWGTAWGIGWALNPDTLWWQTAFTYLCPAVVIMSLTALIPRSVEVER